MAAELHKTGVICIFFSAPPAAARPDFALGCLPKPCSDKALAGAIKIAEAVIEGLRLPPAPLGFELYRN